MKKIICSDYTRFELANGEKCAVSFKHHWFKRLLYFFLGEKLLPNPIFAAIQRNNTHNQHGFSVFLDANFVSEVAISNRMQRRVVKNDFTFRQKNFQDWPRVEINPKEKYWFTMGSTEKKISILPSHWKKNSPHVLVCAFGSELKDVDLDSVCGKNLCIM